MGWGWGAPGPPQAKAQRSEIGGAGRGGVAGTPCSLGWDLPGMGGWEGSGLCSECEGKPWRAFQLGMLRSHF